MGRDTQMDFDINMDGDKCAASGETMRSSVRSVNVILPGEDAANVCDEPLGGVKSQNPHAMVTLQPQLQEHKLCLCVVVLFLFFFTEYASLLTLWHRASVTPDPHVTNHEHVHETGEVTQAVSFTQPSVSYQPILTSEMGSN